METHQDRGALGTKRATAAFGSQPVPPPLPVAAFAGSRAGARKKFETLSTCLMREDGTHETFRTAANELYALFNDIGGGQQDVSGAQAFRWQQETLLPEGLAINPYTAAACVLDYARTRAFARGIRQAVLSAQRTFPGERIDILYAGAGPYAPLAFMQTLFFTSHEVGFTLIDLHEPALRCQAQIASVLGLENYIEQAVQADAIRWAPPPGEKYHIVAAEVMQRALGTEPQVAVTMALSKYLRTGGFFIPESVELTICLMDPGAEMAMATVGVARQSEYFRRSGDRIPSIQPETLKKNTTRIRGRRFVARPFTLTKSVSRNHTMSPEGRIALPTIRLPNCIPDGHTLRVLTKVTAWDAIVLGDYDSGLTFPEPIWNVPALKPGQVYDVWYEMKGIPGLRLARACHQRS